MKKIPRYLLVTFVFVNIVASCMLHLEGFPYGKIMGS